MAAIGSVGQVLSANGRLEPYGTNSAPVALIRSVTAGSLAYVTRWPRATSSRMISRPGRTWLTTGTPIIAMWVRRLDKRNHSFQVYGEKDTPDRRAATRGTACREARTGARHGNGGAAPAGVSRRSGGSACRHLKGHPGTSASDLSGRGLRGDAGRRGSSPHPAQHHDEDGQRRYRPLPGRLPRAPSVLPQVLERVGRGTQHEPAAPLPRRDDAQDLEPCGRHGSEGGGIGTTRTTVCARTVTHHRSDPLRCQS